MTGFLRRHGLSLLLVAALVALFFTQTRPALRERARLRAEQQAQQARLSRERDGLRRLEVWRDHMADDELLRERALEELRRSPERTGPLIVPASRTDTESPAPDDAAR